MPTDTEHCVQALEDRGWLWTQNTMDRHCRIQTAYGHRTLWTGTTEYRLPVDTEHCVQAQQNTDCLWTQNTVQAVVNEAVRCVQVRLQCKALVWFQ